MSGDYPDVTPDPNAGGQVGDAGATSDDVERLNEIGAELSAVESTLRRLDDGTYGTCEICGAALDPAGLEGQPVLARCPLHS